MTILVISSGYDILKESPVIHVGVARPEYAYIFSPTIIIFRKINLETKL